MNNEPCLYLRVGQIYDDQKYSTEMAEELLKCRRAANRMNLEWQVILSPKRTQELCDFRFIAMKHLRDKGFTYKEMGLVFGKRDHSTACYSVKQANALLDTDATFRHKYTIFKQS
jgi:chromosomal replication initiation ATPase DnaA